MTWYRCSNLRKISYISSTGAQQLNLPVYMDEDIVIKTKVLIPQTYPSETSIINNEWNINCMAFYIGQNTLVLRDTSSHIVNITNKPWEWIDIEFDSTDGSLIYDGTKYGGNGGSYNHKVISLFGIENGHFSHVAMQALDVYKAGILVMHLEPRKDSSTGAGYYYDTIGEQSYYSATNTPLVYNEMG